MTKDEKFGLWTTIDYPFKKRNKTYIKCKCICGKIKDIRTDGLIKGMTTSCGCKGKSLDIKIGYKFNCFEVVSEIYTKTIIGKNRTREFKFLDCKCKCGKIRSMKLESVKTAHQYSCGCERSAKVINGIKHCRKCNKYCNIQEFNPCKHSKDGYRNICRTCLKEKYIKAVYNLSLEDYQKILNKQDGKCAICLSDNPCKNFANKNKIKYFIVDHCHKTGKVRGLLCAMCNTSIGGLGDTAESVYKAYTYLKRFENDHC